MNLFWQRSAIRLYATGQKRFLSWEDAVDWLLQQPDKQQLVRDCYYDKPLIRAAERYHKSPEWLAVNEFLPLNRGSCLDVGAGNGIASYALAKNKWDVIAVEPDTSSLVGAAAIQELARTAGLPIRVVVAKGEALPFNDHQFHLVFARQVLHHASDLPQLCRELYRVLKPGGRLVAVRDHVISKPSDLPRFLDGHPLHRLYGGENAYRLSEYKRALIDAGFRRPTVLGPFDTAINYAPHTIDSLREELVRRSAIQAPWAISLIVQSRTLLRIGLRLLSKIDRRPGRLFSFVCDR